jgi:natural product biosynthesis luciferase-like monooxygenase protein/amino acid adenylation domain-containing protein
MRNDDSARQLSLTEAQRGVWIAQQLDPASPRYNCGGYLDISGTLDPALLGHAVAAVLDETEAMRARFVTGETGVGQIIAPRAAEPLEVIDLTMAPDAAAAALRDMTEDLGHAQPLQGDTLTRHVLYRIAPQRHFFYLRYHHILMDGYSQIIYWRRIADIYNALESGATPAPSLARPLAQLLDAEAAYAGSERFDRDRQAWIERLANPPPPLRLAGRATEVARGRRRLGSPVPASTLARLRSMANGLGKRWSVLVIAALAAHARRYAGTDDIVLALPVAGRTSAAAATTPSMLANELPLRLNVDLNKPFCALVEEAAEAIGFVLAHQHYRGEALHRDLGLLAQEQRLGSVVVNVISFDQQLSFGTAGTVPHYLSSGPVKDLLIGCYGRADTGDIDLYFDANADGYTPDELSDQQAQFLHLFEALLSAPADLPLGRIDPQLPSEREQLAQWNDTDRPYDLSRCLHQLIDEQAARTPARIAAAVADASLSYAELQASAERLAAYMVQQGVSPGQVVGVCEVRSLELVIGLLATLKCGAAYLPLDPDQPAKRLGFQLGDSGARMLLTRSSLTARLPSMALPVFCLDKDLAALPAPQVPLGVRGTPDDAAYVIYTSGSTGQPKGVAVPHRGVVNRLLWMQEAYGLQEDDCVLQKTPYTFDVSVWEFFWPLITGARLFLAEPGAQRDPRRMAAIIDEQAVTTVHFVPPMLDLFLEEQPFERPTPLRRVICSGEALGTQTVATFMRAVAQGGPTLHNLYGPTEASIDVTHWTCSAHDGTGPVPIGHPVANTRLHILDTAGRPVPIGVAGELHIAGVQVALGYLNRPELNARSFIPNPFGPGKLYRTGDLARHRPDGAIEYLGRIDQQIKIRGQRIEPGEIEAALLAHPRIRHAHVGAWQATPTDRRLVAWIVTGEPANAHPALGEELAASLAGRLPDYMVAQHFVQVDELPLTRNGKIDRAALPLPHTVADACAASLDTPNERLLAGIWAELLGIDAPSPLASFFALGGDSMLALRMRTLVERQGYTVDVQDIFRFPILRQLAARLGTASAAQAAAPVPPFALLKPEDRARLPQGLADAYPVSAMQGGMLFHAELDAGSSVYRVVTSLHIGAPFNDALLRAAIAETVRRHPVLRTSFDLSNFSEPLQLVHRAAEAPLHVVDTTLGMPDTALEELLGAWVQKAKHHSFDLAAPPLLAFTVHLRDAQSFQLSVVEHHVILDGWSDAAMLQEVVDRYAAALDEQELWLPELPLGFVDYIAEERLVRSAAGARAFWSTALEHAVSTPLPGRGQFDAQESAHGYRAFTVPVRAGMLERLQAVARDAGLPLKSLLAAAHVAVHRLVCNTEHVVSGLVVNARPERDGGDAMLGVFLNTLPFAVDTAGKSLLAVAAGLFDFEREAYAYRGYPVTDIQQLHPELNLDSYVNFIDFHSLWQRRGKDGALIRHGVGVAETNFALSANFLVDPIDGTLRAWLDCNLGQLDASFCARLAGYYERALAALADHPTLELAQTNLIGAEESAQLAAWNDTAVDYDRNATLHALIEQQVDRAPDAIAVVHRHAQVSYAELDRRANRLAHHLLDAGVRPGDLVGISLYRGIEMLVAMFAIHKAGAAYVPLDPDYPRERLAYIACDACMRFLVAEQACPIAGLVAGTILVDRDAATIAARPATRPALRVPGSATAYVIYTSGSTGQPKGTPIRHHSVVNFFVGMDERIGCATDDVVLALTSMSFDISVLELLWPLARGAKAVVAGEKIIQRLVADGEAARRPLDMSLFFFSAAAGGSQAREGYRLVMEAAKAADALGLHAVWTPERHFHEFGGLYPNPSVMSAALAAVTERIAIRCGSVVAPLHDTLRLAEEWSLVDNLSKGRVGLAFAAGWNANDFALAPQAYAGRRQQLPRQIEEFRRLWRGEALERVNGNGEQVALRIFPQPVQESPPIWLTSAGAVETFERAGACGANLLTHLLGQDIGELARKIAAYRAARRQSGYTTEGRVTVMVHTFLDDDAEAATALAWPPFREYLRTSTELWRQLFDSMGVAYPEKVTAEDLESVLDLAVDRYFERSGLFGSPESVLPTVRQLAAAGADELACLIDFGVATDAALDGVAALARLQRLYERDMADAGHSLAELCARHGVTLVQSTPSLMAAVCAEPQALAALDRVRAVLVGGEAFPAGLAERLLDKLPNANVYNMYGPTETTIWSTVHALARDARAAGNVIPIGKPIANTEILVLDAHMRPTPIGVAGELWIGGDGVAGEYLGKPEMTRQRFPTHPSGTGCLYRTGDRARWRADGLLEFLGRVDRQVKILGHRIEPDEVESVLSRHPHVAAVAVVARAGEGGHAELVAYVSAQHGPADLQAEQAHVQRWEEIWEDAYADPDSGVDHAPGSEFAGWNSSFTGKPIPADEMRAWLGQTVASILRLQPRALVDVGVGMGLVLRNLAPVVERYLGLDVSPTALAAARASVERVGHEACKLELRRGDAAVLAEIGSGSADTVVINSVIQYFPGVDYLDKVLREAVRIVGARGAVFVGDVRHLGLIEAFHASVQLAHSEPLATLAELKAAVARKVADESELCVDPHYFVRLGQELDDIGEVMLELKHSNVPHELGAFRYDVVLRGEHARAEPAGRLGWGSLLEPEGEHGPAVVLDTLDGLGILLEQLDSTPLRVTGIPNRRLARPLALLRLLDELAPDTIAWELERQLWAVEEGDAIDPEAITRLARDMGLEVRLLVGADGDMARFDAQFSLPTERTGTPTVSTTTPNRDIMEQLS